MNPKKYVVKFYEPGNVAESFVWYPEGEPEDLPKEDALRRFDFVQTIADGLGKLEGQWNVSRVVVKSAATGKVKLSCFPGKAPKGPWVHDLKAIQKNRTKHAARPCPENTQLFLQPRQTKPLAN